MLVAGHVNIVILIKMVTKLIVILIAMTIHVSHRVIIVIIPLISLTQWPMMLNLFVDRNVIDLNVCVYLCVFG